jgi:hypothetical protein
MSSIQSVQSSAAPYDATSPVMDGGDLGAELAELEIKNGDAERSIDHTQRSVDEAAQQAADAAQVQNMHDEASSMVVGAWVNGAIGVAAAGASVLVPPAATGGPSTWGMAASDLGTAGGKLTDGLFGAAEHRDEADAAQDKAASDRYASDAKDAADAATSADATVSTALDFARSYVATEAQTQAAALHRA